MRTNGILLAISSLPSEYGIGTFSKEAYQFVDFLKASGQSLWQILPLGPTGYGDSPYQSFSTFAGNPYYIDLEEFIEKGWLTKEECSNYNYGLPEFVEYDVIYTAKFALLRSAFEKSDIENDEDFLKFRKENAWWLEDYALFMAVKYYHNGVAWTDWPLDIKMREEHALERYREELANEILFYCFQQYYFFEQCIKLKQYANKNGIRIVGDIPIYVAMDSADAWANPKLFELDRDCNPINVAGCPPDAFSKRGQLWGNPLYRWSYHKSTGYDWWMKRMAQCYRFVDIVRIDHFRGFDEYYAIPYGREDAVIGTWLPGPGYDLFRTMRAKLGKKPVIAEDLGLLTNSVVKMVKKTGFPGMKVLQFAFDSSEESEYLPHNYEKNCVVYTGTHDNDTTRHWYESMGRKDKSFARRYLHIKSPREAVDKMVEAAMGSVADTCIIPMQDFLKLGAEARINTPSTMGMNWKWRMEKDAMSDVLSEEIYRLTKLYGRLPK